MIKLYFVIFLLLLSCTQQDRKETPEIFADSAFTASFIDDRKNDEYKPNAAHYDSYWIIESEPNITLILGLGNTELKNSSMSLMMMMVESNTFPSAAWIQPDDEKLLGALDLEELITFAVFSKQCHSLPERIHIKGCLALSAYSMIREEWNEVKSLTLVNYNNPWFGSASWEKEVFEPQEILSQLP